MFNFVYRRATPSAEFKYLANIMVFAYIRWWKWKMNDDSVIALSLSVVASTAIYE